MQVVHRLSPVRSAVDDETVPSVVQPFAVCDAGRKYQEFSGQTAVGILQFRKAGDVTPGNYKDVGRRLGVDVPEGKELFIAMHFCAWYFACGDVAEKTGTHLIPFQVQVVLIRSRGSWTA